jgi:hypothetical protein
MKDFLLWPIGRGDIEVVKKFIAIGVPVQDPGLWNEAIKGSNRHNQTIPICKALLEAGLDVNTEINYYGSPLIRAVHYRNIELIHLFLEYDADMTAIDPDSGYSVYEIAVHQMDQKVIDVLAEHMQKKGIPVPAFQPAPATEQITEAMEQDHTDLVLLSLYGSNPDNHFTQLHALKEKLAYRKDAIPFYIQHVSEEEEEEYSEDWYDNYEAPLSDYQILFHPTDTRCYILLIDWYDDFLYSTIYHLHVCCEKQHANEIHALLQDWFDDLMGEDNDQEFLERYPHGVYRYDWSQTNPTEEEKKRLEEAQSFYVLAAEEIQEELR